MLELLFSPTFSSERKFFQEFRERLARNLVVADQMSGAIGNVLTRYNTVVWENRFIVGGVVEQIVGAAARAVGLPARNVGKQNQGFDLLLDDGAGLSIKGVFASIDGKHNLINIRGPKEAKLDAWKQATLFVMANTGIGYTDPQFGAGFLSASSDALQISGRDLRAWWTGNPEWLIASVRVPPKPTGPALRVASDPVALDVLAGFPLLAEHYQPEM